MFSTRYKSLRDIDLLEEYIDSYPNNQKEIGESIYEIYELIKNNLIKDDMKKNLFFLVILLCLSLFSVKAQSYDPPFVSHTPVFSVTQRNLGQVILDDGLYELAVEYQSNSTNYEVYTLEVRIKNDNITHIYFGNGGYVHNEWNNSGYTWTGGGIRWNVDYYGNIISGKAVIQLN